MVVLLMTTISCSQAIGTFQRISNVVGLTETQKIQIIHEIRKTIPFCPIKVIKDDGRNSK
jgi:hypothetical protein